jgi:hypothetical protein
MSQPIKPTQEDVRKQIADVIETLQRVWDISQPTESHERSLTLIQMVLCLLDPAYAGYLDNLVKVALACQGNKTRVLAMLAEMDESEPEYGLVEFILGDNSGMPAWPDVAARVVEIASAATPAAPVQQPAATPPPVQPQQPLSPAERMVQLQQQAGQPQQPTVNFYPNNPQPAPQQPVQTPVAPAANAAPSNSNGNGKVVRRERRPRVVPVVAPAPRQ